MKQDFQNDRNIQDDRTRLASNRPIQAFGLVMKQIGSIRPSIDTFLQPSKELETGVIS